MRYALGIEYEGTAYQGWQKQTGTYAVQSKVEAAISYIADHPVDVTCAGRTDKGVHALGQVIHFDTSSHRDNYAWLMGINRYLPADINVHWIKSVSADFHARFSATARQYRYLIYAHPHRSGIFRDHMTWIYHALDIEAMRTGAAYLVGKHDFTSFRAQDCQAKTATRQIMFLNIIQEGPCICIDIKANAFLYHMVRNIVGVLLQVGRGKAKPEWVAEVLAQKDRRKAGITAPATGLYFIGADYPERFELPALFYDSPLEG